MALGEHVDIVGTGGDGSGSLNLSTGAGLLAATHLLLGWGLWRIVAAPRARPVRLALLVGLLLWLSGDRFAFNIWFSGGSQNFYVR